MSPHVWKSGFWNKGNFCLWNPESWAFKSRKQLKESRIPLTIGIRNPRPGQSWIQDCLRFFYMKWNQYRKAGGGRETARRMGHQMLPDRRLPIKKKIGCFSLPVHELSKRCLQSLWIPFSFQVALLSFFPFNTHQSARLQLVLSGSQSEPLKPSTAGVKSCRYWPSGVPANVIGTNVTSNSARMLSLRLER